LSYFSFLYLRQNILISNEIKIILFGMQDVCTSIYISLQVCKIFTTIYQSATTKQKLRIVHGSTTRENNLTWKTYFLLLTPIPPYSPFFCFVLFCFGPCAFFLLLPLVSFMLYTSKIAPGSVPTYPAYFNDLGLKHLALILVVIGILYNLLPV
jgi:hypothetical protein